MVCFDKTHVQLTKYLQNTETTFNKLLSPYRIVQLFLLILVLMYAHVLFLKLMMIF